MILVLDLGSSSTRAALFDNAANAIDGLSARVPVTFAVSDDGRNEDDANAAFARVIEVLDTLHAQLNQHALAHEPIDAIGISCWASSLVCLDDASMPLTPVFTYADTRCAPDARRLRDQCDELAALQRTGCRIRANYLPAKIEWVRRMWPSAFVHTRMFASLSDFVMARLFGRMRAGISIASWSGLLNRQTSSWDVEWLRTLNLAPEKLPPLGADGETVDGLLPEWRTRWPKFAHVRCHAPVGDGAAANVGTGCVDSSRIAATIGTTAAMRVVTAIDNRQSAMVNSALWSYRVDHAHALIGGATTEGGNVIAWARQTLRLADDAAVESAIHSQVPDAHGLTVLPTFAGERSPGYAENIRATLHGLSLDTSPVQLVRALMEGIAYRLAHICDALRNSGTANANAILAGSGGGLMASPTWCQIIADVCGVPLEVADIAEATSKGVALLATGVWLRKDQPIANLRSLVYYPNSQHYLTYRAAMARQQELYAKLV